MLSGLKQAASKVGAAFFHADFPLAKNRVWVIIKLGCFLKIAGNKTPADPGRQAAETGGQPFPNAR